MIPGRAIGSRSKNETASRPKNEKRAIANDAAVEHESDGGGQQPDLDREPERRADIRVVPGLVEPVERQILDRPRLQHGAVERVGEDDQDREPEEGDHQHRPDGEANPRAAAAHRASNAPNRFAITRYAAITRTGTVANAAAKGMSGWPILVSTMLPMKLEPAPPTSAGVMKSPRVSEKVKIDPATSPGRASGRITVRSVRQALAPRSCEAS